MRSRRKRRGKHRAQARVPVLLNSDLRDETQNFVVRDVVEFAFVFFLEAFAQKFRGDEAGFTVGEIAAGFFAKRGEPRMGEADDERVVFHKEFRVYRVGVARGNAVPHVRKTAAIIAAAQFRLDVKDADKFTHFACVCQHRVGCHHSAPESRLPFTVCRLSFVVISFQYSVKSVNSLELGALIVSLVAHGYLAARAASACENERTAAPTPAPAGTRAP